jgi:hypothetical protein
MTCRQIEKVLPAYLEDVLSPQEKRHIQEHLSACDNCSRSLADLKAMGKLLHEIEEVEPPPWLKAKIMSRVREEVNWKKELYRRLFQPFRIKVPIQIFATIIIAVLAYSVYMQEEPEFKRLAPPLPPPVHEAVKGQAAGIGSRKIPAAPPVSPAEEKRPSPIGELVKTDEEKAGVSPSTGAGDKVRLGDLPKEKAVVPQVIRPAPPIGALQEKDVAAEKPPTIDVTLHVRDRDTAIRELETLIAGFDGRIILRQPGIEKTVLTTEIPGKNALAFLEKLKDIGEIKRTDRPLDFSAGPVTVRIEILNPS